MVVGTPGIRRECTMHKVRSKELRLPYGQPTQKSWRNVGIRIRWTYSISSLQWVRQRGPFHQRFRHKTTFPCYMVGHGTRYLRNIKGLTRPWDKNTLQTLTNHKQCSHQYLRCYKPIIQLGALRLSQNGDQSSIASLNQMPRWLLNSQLRWNPLMMWLTISARQNFKVLG